MGRDRCGGRKVAAGDIIELFARGVQFVIRDSQKPQTKMQSRRRGAAAGGVPDSHPREQRYSAYTYETKDDIYKIWGVRYHMRGREGKEGYSRKNTDIRSEAAAE